MDELVVWLRAQLDEDAARVAAAPRGPWSVDVSGSIVDADGGRVVPSVGGALEGRATRWPQGPVVSHVLAYDPARALREIDAKQALLADILADSHFRNEEDNWYSCAALVDENGQPVCFDDSRAPGPCDCGRNARVERRVKLLASPYSHRPGYQEPWRP